MRLTYATAAAAIAAALAWMTIAGVGWANRSHLAEQKAERYDEVCRTVKQALRIDRVLLDQPRSRGLMLERFGQDRIGDGLAMMNWCLPEPFDMRLFSACWAADDDACLHRMIAEAEASLP